MARIIISISLIIIGITVYFLLKPKVHKLKDKVKGSENTFYVPVKSKTGKWGYKNLNGNWTIQPKFDDAWEYYNGLASASVDGKYYGLINTNGEWVVAPEYESIGNYNNGYYLASIKENDYLIDEKGKVLIKADGFDISWNLFSEGLLSIHDYSKGFGFKDVNDNWIIEPKYVFSSDFSEGLASASMDGKKRIYIDKKGKTVLSLSDEIDYAGNFNAGLAPARINKKYGFIDKKGIFVIPPQFDNASDFSEGYAVVFIGEKCFFINNRAEIQTNLKTYEDALKFENGYALVHENGKAGYIDKTGTVVIPIKYDTVFALNKGFCRVLLNGKEFYVNVGGKTFIDN
ncbi:WG repeat-containing protein [Pedobacter punctiformis]|uniref:WG repeat-containing protein n=1 Tax=Pedobacter punctiformis TaxID=3004097 RepID=A0ABT4LDE9_9SPHI|nr:WG repeat-containing protein [Pedobacter sp. HCMS5-2]MCZ4245914.1 WG repeat-containing protein [Pedobacter sp. HCMS5-2]